MGEFNLLKREKTITSNHNDKLEAEEWIGSGIEVSLAAIFEKYSKLHLHYLLEYIQKR